MRATSLTWCTLVLATSASACSWARYDDITRNSPIVLLDRPGALKRGFGNSIATLTSGGHTQVLVGGGVGVSRAALFEIGKGESPGTTSIDSGYCASDEEEPCYLSSSLAGFANAPGPDMERPRCFAVGSGAIKKSGIELRCEDASEYTLDMPKVATDLLAFAIKNDQPYDFPLATDRSEQPALLVSLPEKRSAWFYAPGSLRYNELAVPAALSNDSSFGSSLSVLALGKARVFALGVPGKSEVLLWKSEGKDSSYIGCLGGAPGFGRALSAGPVNADADDDLVIADDAIVTVIDGQALASLPPTDSAECGFSSLPAGALLGSFGCGSDTSMSGCAESHFGAALAVGDLNGDGNGEIVVGAPDMTVRGEERAGAILIYDVADPADASFADAKFLSSAEAGDRLGASLATPHIEGRDIIAAGAAGNGKAALFYCSPLLGPGKAGERCE